MNGRKNILLISYEFPPAGGGGSRQFSSLARELAHDHAVFVLTAGWDTFGVSDEDGYRIQRLRIGRKRIDRCSVWEMATFVFRAWLNLPKIVASFHPDAAIIFFAIPTGVLVFHPALAAQKVVCVRGSDVPGHNPHRFKVLYAVTLPAVKMIWRKAARVVCNSPQLRDEVRGILPGLPVDIIPNGIDTDRFRPVTHGRRGGPLRVISVGRLIPLKRFDILIRAVGELVREGEEVTLVIAGSGREERALKELARQLGIAPKVRFAGHVAHEAMAALYGEADLYVQVSEAEGMSNTMLEAMACGLPVISTDVGGAAAVIAGNGRVLQDATPAAVAEAIRGYREDEEQRRRHAVESRRIAERFSYMAMAASFEALIGGSL